MILRRFSQIFIRTTEAFQLATVEAKKLMLSQLSIRKGIADTIPYLKAQTIALWENAKAWFATPFGKGTLITAGIVAGVALVAHVIDLLTLSTKELDERIETTTGEIEELGTQIGDIEEKIKAIEGKSVSDLTDPGELAELEREAKILERQAAALRDIQREKEDANRADIIERTNRFLAGSDYSAGEVSTGYSDYTRQMTTEESIAAWTKQYTAANAEIDKLIAKEGEFTDAEQKAFDAALARSKEAQTALRNIQTDLGDYLQQYLDSGGEITGIKWLDDLIQGIADLFPKVETGAEGAGDGLDEMGEAADDAADKAETLIEALNGLSDSLSIAKDVFADFNDDGELTYATLANIAEKFSDVDGIEDYINALADTELTAEDLREIMSDLAIAQIQQKLKTQELTGEHYNLIVAMLEEAGVANADEIAQWLLADAAAGAAKATGDAAGAKQGFNDTKIDTSGDVSQLGFLEGAFYRLGAAARQAMADAKAAYAENVEKLTRMEGRLDPNYTPPKVIFEEDDKPGGGGGGSSKKTDLEIALEAYDAKMKALEHDIKMMEREGAPQSKIIAAYLELQDLAHQAAEEYRAANQDLSEYEREHSETIMGLQDAWWGYRDAIEDVYKDMKDTLKDVLDDVKDAQDDIFDAAIDDIEKQIDALDEVNDAEDKAVELAEKQNKLLELRLKLQNAYENKSLQILRRQADGKWQYDYVADPDEIESITDEIAEAEKDLAEFQRDLQREAEKDALEAQKEALQAQKKASQEYYKDTEALADEFFKTLIRITGGNTDQITAVYLAALERLKAGTITFAELLNELAAGMGAGGVGGGMPTVLVNPDGKAPTGLSVGTQVVTDAGVYVIDSVNPDGTYESTKISEGEYTGDYDLLKKKFEEEYGFDKGGVIDYTGPAIVHGSKSSSEVAFKAEDAKKLYNIVRALPVGIGRAPRFAGVAPGLGTQTMEHNYHIDKVVLPNVRTKEDAEALFEGIELAALQFSNKR